MFINDLVSRALTCSCKAILFSITFYTKQLFVSTTVNLSAEKKTDLTQLEEYFFRALSMVSLSLCPVSNIKYC